MSKAVITVKLDNEAFGTTDNTRGAELSRILYELADKLATNGFDVVYNNSRLKDINGNNVGEIEIND